MRYLEGLKTIVERSSLFADKDVKIAVVANPVAGGFTIRGKAAQNLAFFNAAVASVESRPVVASSCAISVYPTTEAGHARRIAREILDVASRDQDKRSIYLIVTAGGDGTSLEVQSEFAKFVLEEGKADLSELVCLLRLPFGTGNDGSDGRSLDQSLALLTGETTFQKQSAVRVSTSGQNAKSWYAFNIASVGLDAFVTYMTNKVKHLFPGDFYKIWVDLACLFYDRIYRIGEMSVIAEDRDGKELRRDGGRMILYLMGASGSRTYGSNQKILPDERNVCGMRDMSLARKLTLKPHLKDGSHAAFPECILYSANRIVIDYGERILLQLDGEGHLLEPTDFPLTMELSVPFIKTLKTRR